MKIFLLVVVAYICFSSENDAQVRETRLKDPSGAFSFVVPDKWKSESNTEGFAMANPEKTVILIVKTHNYASFEDFVADANLARDGLEHVGEPQRITNGVTFRTAKRAQQGTMVVDTCVLFSPNGGGLVIVGLSDEENATASFEAGLAVANSVQFSKPAEGGSGPFVAQLKGKHLLYLFTGNGYSERKDIYLCSSGEFYQSNDMGGFNPNDSGDSSFGSRRSTHGTWTVSGTTLTLQFRGAGTTRHALSKRSASNEVALNGQRFFVKAQNVCN